NQKPENERPGSACRDRRALMVSGFWFLVFYRFRSINAFRFGFGIAPMARSTSLPSLNISRVGMEVMPNFIGTVGFSSTFIFARTALPSYDGASSSTIGPMIRQGPHHGAQ